MHAFVARLRDSERAWTAALFCALWLVLAAGSPPGVQATSLVAQAETAALATLLATWVARSSGSRRSGLAIALAAVFTTPLLPYSYVELEPTQSLLLFAAAFFAIGPTRLPLPARGLAFLLASAGLLLAKSGSAFLLPLVSWLAWRGTETGADRSAALRRADPRRGLVAALVLLVALAAFRVSSLAGWSALRATLVSSPIEWLVNIHGFLLSLNKGLLLFAPLALIGLWRAFRGAISDRRAGQFALFAAASLILPYAALTRWSDATWGPRHLLAALAPALLALALSRTERARRGGHRRWIVVAVGLGLAVNTLGTAVPQDALAQVVQLPEDEELMALQFDPRFNQARWNATALASWVLVTPFVPRSPDAMAALAEMAAMPASGPLVVHPAPLLLRVFDARERPDLVPAAWLLLLAGAAGWALLILARHAAGRE